MSTPKPSSPLTVTAVVTAHDRRKYWADAIRSARAAGADEILLVRNFDDPIPAELGAIRDLYEPAPEAGVKEAAGLEAASGDVVAFLDDDDRWLADKVGWLKRLWSDRPTLRYVCHGQEPIDSEGRPVVAHHPEWSRVHRTGSTPARETLAEPYSIAHARYWPGNNSSTAIDRRWGLSWSARLRAAGWGCDTFWLVACYASEVPGQLTTEVHTQLRLHTENMSQTRGADAAEFQRRHRQMAERFTRALSIMVDAVAALPPDRGRADVLRSLRPELAGWDLFRRLERNELSRRAALATLASRLPRSARMTAILAAVSPDQARNALYRSSQRRWSL